MSYFLYILRNDKNKLYIGQSSNLVSRLERHSKDGALYVRNDPSYKVVYTEEYKSRPEAMRRERQLKGWARAKKEALISGNFELLKKL